MPLFPAIPDPPYLTEADRRWLGESALDALRRHFCLEASADPSVQAGEGQHSVLSRRAGAFVTLYCGSELRGCLGAVAPSEPLQESVARLAVAAATQDRRFDPLTRAEFVSSRLEITILGELVRLPAEPEGLLSGLIPAEHGVQVRAARRSGLLLPQVARRQGWSALELLRQVCCKAGCEPDAWRGPPAEVYGFRASSFEVRSPDLGVRDQAHDT